MKKFIALLLVAVLALGMFAACGNTNNPNTPDNPDQPDQPDNPGVENPDNGDDEPALIPYENAFEVALELFNTAGVELFSNIEPLNYQGALNMLNYGQMHDRETISAIEGFVSGVYMAPPMMLATQAVCILQFDSAKNLTEYAKALEYLQYKQVCVTPDPATVHVITKGNFICYISAAMPDEEDWEKVNDYGPALVDAFNAMNLEGRTEQKLPESFKTVYAQYVEAAKYADIWTISSIPTDSISLYFDGATDIDFTKVTGLQTVESYPDYMLETPAETYIKVMVISTTDEATANSVKAFAEAHKADTYSYFAIEEGLTATYTIEGTDVVITSKR